MSEWIEVRCISADCGGRWVSGEWVPGRPKILLKYHRGDASSENKIHAETRCLRCGQLNEIVMKEGTNNVDWAD